MLTRKHFIALAECIKVLPIFVEPGMTEPQVYMSDVLDALCKFGRSQNPAFDEDRFRDYIKGECGPREGKIE